MYSSARLFRTGRNIEHHNFRLGDFCVQMFGFFWVLKHQEQRQAVKPWDNAQGSQEEAWQQRIGQMSYFLRFARFRSSQAF